MTAIIKGAIVTGTPAEIKELIDLYDKSRGEVTENVDNVRNRKDIKYPEKGYEE